MRNRVVHGYQTVRDDIVYATIKEGLPLFVDELNSFAAARYRKFLEGYLGKRVRIIVDSSYDLGDFRASIGTVDGLLGLDGRYQKACLVSLIAPRIESTGTVKAIIGQEKGDFGQLVVFEDGIFLKETEEEMITRLRSFRL